jgi:uncharacterized membrane protein YfcA
VGFTDLFLGATVLAAVTCSFFVSASAGLGGSLILVPTLSLLLGTKEGVALAALLLAANNLVKVAAYRRVLPLRAATGVAAISALGAFAGARLLVAAPERLVAVAVIVSLVTTFAAERRRIGPRPTLARTLALASGATSGFSGTSGPLKGVAIRSLGLDRFHMIGAGALVSMFGDVTKTAVFADAQLLDASSVRLGLLAAPLMVAATFAGRQFTQNIGERGFGRLFWLVMGGYTARLIAAL